jgi:hypothetical protein
MVVFFMVPFLLTSWTSMWRPTCSKLMFSMEYDLFQAGVLIGTAPFENWFSLWHTHLFQFGVLLGTLPVTNWYSLWLVIFQHPTCFKLVFSKAPHLFQAGIL